MEIKFKVTSFTERCHWYPSWFPRSSTDSTTDRPRK